MLLPSGGLLLLYKLYTFPRWHDEMRYAPRFGLSVLFILAVVVVENLCTFATSASDARKHSYVPLQDNAEIGLLWLFQVGRRPGICRLCSMHTKLHLCVWVIRATRQQCTMCWCHMPLL
jgi:hypothetical protein